MKQCITMLFSMFLWILSIAIVQAEQPVAYIENLAGPGNAFGVIRNDVEQTIAVMSNLYPGDQVIIRPEKCKPNDACTVTFNLCDRQKITVDRVQSPYPILRDFSCQTLPSWPTALMEWAAGMFTSYHKAHRQVEYLGGTMGGKDRLFILPLLMNGQARLIAGERPFALFWRGGEAPYHIRIVQAGGKTPLVEQQDFQVNRIILEHVTLTVGTYTVEISDAQKSTMSGIFQVVPPAELPVFPSEFAADWQQSTIDESAKNTLFALWLLEEQKDWEFEAYQSVAPLAEVYYPALLVRERLELE